MASGPINTTREYEGAPARPHPLRGDQDEEDRGVVRYNPEGHDRIAYAQQSENDYLLAEPRLVEAHDTSTVVHPTGADRSDKHQRRSH